MHAFKATYLVNKVSYAKTDFAILFSTEGAFRRSIDFLFRSILRYKPDAVFMDESDSFNIASENLTGNIWDNKRYLNKILYCTRIFSE